MGHATIQPTVLPRLKQASSHRTSSQDAGAQGNVIAVLTGAASAEVWISHHAAGRPLKGPGPICRFANAHLKALSDLPPGARLVQEGGLSIFVAVNALTAACHGTQVAWTRVAISHLLTGFSNLPAYLRSDDVPAARQHITSDIMISPSTLHAPAPASCSST
ncbi:hypothetical protein OH77DRAFT_353977 [Trametes cingulata]|nr:hypothetical protein OH77DRAFT_353977 [Trametes cingulata]